MTAACLVSTGLILATPGAYAESSSGTGTPTAPRAGAVTLGQVAAAVPANCTPGPTTVAQYLEGGAPSYVTPSAGVITSYSVRASLGAVRSVSSSSARPPLLVTGQSSP